MFEPVSLSAVAAVFGAVGASVASEAGKWAWESAGAFVRRVTGRDVPAPTGAVERAAVAQLLLDVAGSDPAQARAIRAWLGGQGGGWSGPLAAPSLLPPSDRFFTDRRKVLALLDKEAGRKTDGTPRVSVLYGPQGMGVSAAAVHWGALQRKRFPDGQLYADLSGGSPATAPDAAAVLRQFLIHLGMPADRVPPAAQDRVERFRSLVAERQLLVVLDHARSAAQVRPLITAAPGVVTVVVARRPLTGLDAVPIPVGPLSDKDARRLLTDLAGKETVSAAGTALADVLERCGGSPFALRAAAPRLAFIPQQRRGGGGDGGGDPHGGDPVRAAVQESYEVLEPEEARLFRLCALRPWPAVGPELAVAVAGPGGPAVERAGVLLAGLAEAGLVEATPEGRYRYRPAVRRFAEEQAARVDGLAACAGAVTRAVEHLLRFAVRADYAALRERWHVGPLYRELGPGDYPDAGAALAALAAEVGNLVEAVLAAEELAAPATACELAEASWAVQLKAGRHEVLLPALRTAVRAAVAHDPDSAMAGRMHTQLAFALMELDLLAEAESCLVDASSAFERAGHLLGQATAVESLGLLRLRQWRWQPAYDCFEQADGLLASIGPDHERAGDVPRARALLKRHRGRALRGLAEYERARVWLTEALSDFRRLHDNYNAARTLTNLAETWADTSATEEALAAIDEAAAILDREQAEPHLRYLAGLRQQCLTERD
ncbi:tetratricopeptide repeat protein [Kitasatospora sp. NBC_01300]|uniref:tetratricopeptide repeat protein n=1 Tax=Kitasatospora sp. NBC_01300 TaxID=2903574 RepID=UPI00352F1EEA|nr:tetratricopeptide repeat protein [Kitasatospora sp. NBC_01300]